MSYEQEHYQYLEIVPDEGFYNGEEPCIHCDKQLYYERFPSEFTFEFAGGYVIPFKREGCIYTSKDYERFFVSFVRNHAAESIDSLFKNDL